VFELIARLGEVSQAEMWEVFNMGCGFCVVVVPEGAEPAVQMLAQHHPGSAVIGSVTDRGGVVSVPDLGIEGTAAGLGRA
jgi:phosphoribosylformylglycinamidine cyclo-ligase